MLSLSLGLGLSQRGGGGGAPPDLFASAVLDLNFAASEYRQAVDGEVFSTPASLTGWSYTRTGTRTAEYVDASTADFGANVPPITDKGIYVGDAAGASGADVMPILAVTALGSDAAIYVEFYDAAAPATNDILWSLNANQPGHSTAGFITPNGSAGNQSANYGAVVKAAMSYTGGVDRSEVYDGVVVSNNTALNGTVSSKTGIGIARYYTSTGFGQPNTYVKRISVFPQRISTEGLRVLTVQPDRVLAGVGDSIMKGDGVTEFLPLVAAMFTGETVFAPNYGVNGISWVYDWPSDPAVGTMADGATAIGGLFDFTVARGHWMVAFAGTNGIVLKGNTAAQEFADFETWLTATLAEGWAASKIVVCTMLPRTGVSEVTRSDYNDLLVAGASTYGYRLARFDLDPDLGGTGDNLNATYYSDGTHPTDAGHVILADIVYAALVA